MILDQGVPRTPSIGGFPTGRKRPILAPDAAGTLPGSSHRPATCCATNDETAREGLRASTTRFSASLTPARRPKYPSFSDATPINVGPRLLNQVPGGGSYH